MRAGFHIVFAILLALLPLESSGGELIGQLGAKGPDNVSGKIEALYLNAIANGVIPVKILTVKEGDTIQTILRKNNAFAGGYFPQSLNSLACDLNVLLCHRPLVPVEEAANVSGGTPRSTLQFAPSDGDWNKIKAGSAIVIPAFHITRLMNTTEVIKSPRQTIMDLLDENEVCHQNYSSIQECLEIVRWMNNFDPSILTPGYGGALVVPTFEYSVDATCSNLCAVAESNVKVANGYFSEPPFSIRNVRIEQEPPHISVVVGADKVQEGREDISKGLPQTVLNKIVTGDAITKDRGWVVRRALVEHQDLALAAPVSPFDPTLAIRENINSSQTTIFKSIDFPAASLIDPGNLDQNTVMVIDVAFDESHCEFKGRNFVKYSCRPVSLADPNCTAAPPYSETTHGDRKLCGSAGVYTFEPNPLTRAFSTPRHGTHIAGIIGANWDKYGIAGISERARIIGVEVDLDKLLSAPKYGQWLSSRIRDIASQNGVSVIVLAAGDESGSAKRNWFYEFAQAYDRTITFVVSGGNTKTAVGDPCPVYPACYTQDLYNLISVVGLEVDQATPMPNSTFYPSFSVGAVGRDVPGPTPMNNYASMSGSSQAAAVVAGAISYAVSIPKNGKWEPAQIRNRLVACSNVTSDLLQKMQGGGLDVECLAEADVDMVKENGKVSIGTNAKILPIAAGEAGMVRFQNDDDDDVERLTFSRILGFQKVKNDDGRVVIYYASNEIPRKARIERRVGNFVDPDQKLKLSTRSYSLSDIEKYVRAKD